MIGIGKKDWGENMTKKKTMDKIFFRFYDIPRESYLLALYGAEWKRKYGSEGESLHFHNHLEVGYCYEGEGVIRMENGDLPYFSQMFTVIPKNCPHAIQGEKGGVDYWEFLFIDMERFLLDLYPGRNRLVEEICRRINRGARLLTYEKNPVLGDLVQELLREMKEKGEFYQESVKGYLLAFLMGIARLDGEAAGALVSDKRLPVVGKNLWKEEIRQVEAALRYVEEHYREPLHAGDLAAVCGLSETHFRRLFQKNMQMTPMEYVNKVRIREACRLMLETNASLEEIAVKTGFVSMSTFNRNFGRFLSISPHAWRKSRGKGQKILF